MRRASRVRLATPGHRNNATIRVVVCSTATNIIDAIDLDRPAFVRAVSYTAADDVSRLVAAQGPTRTYTIAVWDIAAFFPRAAQLCSTELRTEGLDGQLAGSALSRYRLYECMNAIFCEATALKTVRTKRLNGRCSVKFRGRQ